MQQTCPNEEEDPQGAMEKTPQPSGSTVDGPRVIADLQISAHVDERDGRATSGPGSVNEQDEIAPELGYILTYTTRMF
jgi:hypothetical protein